MEHSQLVTASDLATYAIRRDAAAIIPELIYLLVHESVPDLTACRIPYGDAINQPGWDGFVDTASGFRQFVPEKQSYWEIGTGGKPQKKATSDFKHRTRKLTKERRQASSFVFVTPHGAEAGGWNEPSQAKWKERYAKFGWSQLKILDNVQICDWLREFPALGKWLLKKMDVVRSVVGFSTPAEHWENLEHLSVGHKEPPLPRKLFLVDRDQAAAELDKLFRGEIKHLALTSYAPNDVEDFVSAWVASLDKTKRQIYSNRCLFISDPETWSSMAQLKAPHVLVANSSLDLEHFGEQLHLTAIKKNHSVIVPVSGAWASGDKQIHIPHPSAGKIEATLTEAGFTPIRARELGAAGALSLAALKRKLRGLGELPDYVKWEAVRALAQAIMFSRWQGGNGPDVRAMETVLGKPYGEWIETVRPMTLRPDAPLIQRNESWKVISRGESWQALGPHLSNDDLDRFQKMAVTVLGERNPKFELPAEDRFAASMRGKVLQHSPSLRQGVAETLALLGSWPKALTSCSHGKPELVALLTVRSLLKNADWVGWASLDRELPQLAEAAPDEFLDAVELALLQGNKNPFRETFAQETSGITGGTYMSGLLWALETLAWNPSYLQRVTVILGELAAIDPGGNWTNRPSNSLKDIFLPWHAQTCAPLEKRLAALGALIKEQRAVAWKLLIALLPSMSGFTTGTRKPTWRKYIPPDWTDKTTQHNYRAQVEAYSNLVVEVAQGDILKFAELIDRLPYLPTGAQNRVLDHFKTVASSLDELSRLPLWEALMDLSRKHRKFPDAVWSMKSDDIARIEQAAQILAPQSIEGQNRRVFSDREFDLYDEIGDHEEQRTQLNQRRDAVVRDLLKSKGLNGLINFAKQVPSPATVGLAAGRVAPAEMDSEILPRELTTDAPVLKAFVANYVWARFWDKGLKWVESVLDMHWQEFEKLAFLLYLPFRNDIWLKAEAFLQNHGNEYWQKANVQPFGDQPNLEYAVLRLIENGRPRSALWCISRLIDVSPNLDVRLPIRALLESVGSTEPIGAFDQYQTIELIEWLRKRGATEADLFKIEWAYLPLFDYHAGQYPETLANRLANDPSFFCDIIGIVFRSDKEPKRESSESEKIIATNAYRLLHSWRTPPGQGPHDFDDAQFARWLKEVKAKASESGHFDIAMDQIGKVLICAPADPSGLWIRREIANALNDKDAEAMRDGFTTGLFNTRGVHGYTAGKEELGLANRFHRDADALESSGFHRFAKSIREIANTYERDAEREALQNPYDE